MIEVFRNRLFNLVDPFRVMDKEQAHIKKQLLLKIGNRIRSLREKKGISQAELGRRCLQGSSWMARIENGNVNSSIFTYHIVAEALEVNLDELFKVD